MDSHSQTTPDIFATTHWSVVLRAQSTGDEAASRAALDQLCQVYWPSLYGYARRSGHHKEDAEDLTQGFFGFWLEKRAIDSADRQRGRFRAFLITSFKNFIHNEWEKSQAQKRGGGNDMLSLDFESAETRYQAAPQVDDASAGYDHDWATTVFATALASLRREYDQSRSKRALFELLCAFLWLDSGDTGGQASYTESARLLKMSEAAVKMAVSRMRKRFRCLLREEVTQTLSDPKDLDEEFRYLVEVLRKAPVSLLPKS